MSTGLVLTASNLPSTEIAANYDDLSKAGDYLQRIQLCGKGKYVDRGLIRPGHYGVPINDDEVTDLGAEIDILPLARRPQAMDFSDRKAVIAVYDDSSPEFSRIREAADASGESNCSYGVSFLVIERNTGKLYELFCGSKSMRAEAKNLYPALPHIKDGEVVQPSARTLKSRYMDKAKFPYHAPVTTLCSTPFDKLPTNEVIAAAMEKFLNPKGSEIEVVDDKKSNRRAR